MNNLEDNDRLIDELEILTDTRELVTVLSTT